MYKITVIDLDQEEHEYENVSSYWFPAGGLQLNHTDGSSTIYAPGSWLEAAVQRVDNPQSEDYQV